VPTFQYTAKDQNARTITGKIVATDETQVLDELRKRRLVIIAIKEQRSSMLTVSSEGAKPIKIEEVILFTRQMATMVMQGSRFCRRWKLYRSRRLILLSRKFWGDQGRYSTREWTFGSFCQAS